MRLPVALKETFQFFAMSNLTITAAQQLSSTATTSAITGGVSSGIADFPFNFLYAEMVRYFKERDEEVKARKAQWVDQVAQSDFAEVLRRDNDAIRNMIFAQGNAESRLEAIGYRVGFVLVERVAKDVPRLTNELETIKFVCKEFWSTAFGKPVDNIRTNHKGIYIIQDNKFTTVAALSNGLQFIDKSVIFLMLPCGVIRGALANLGIAAIVTTEVDSLPRVKFNIQLNK